MLSASGIQYTGDIRKNAEKSATISHEIHEIVELRILAARTHCTGENTSVKWTCSMTGRSVSGKEGSWNTSRNGLI